MPKKMQLPSEVPESKPQSAASPGYYPGYPATQYFEPEASTSVPLSHYLWILERHAWKMAAFVAVCMLIAFVVSSRIKPLYESTVTIDVDFQAPSEVLGDTATGGSNIYDPDEFLSTQIKLIQSDAVLRPVAEQFHLVDFNASNKDQNSKKGQVSVQAPVSLGSLKVTRPTNTFILLISYRAQDPRVAADIANAVANSYINHLYDIRIRSSASMSSFMEKQLDELKAKMERSGLALNQFEKDMEVINPDQKTDILSARLTQLNTEYTAAQAERIREEAAWNAMKLGSVEAAEVSSEGQSLVALAGTVNQAREHLAEVKAIYGVNHPEYHKAASALAALEKQFQDTHAEITNRIEAAYKNSLSREQNLQKAVADTKAQWDLLNSRSYQYQQLKQEAEADKALYNELVKKIHEADINEGFKDNNVRIADAARPDPSPVYPNTRRNLEVMFIFSLLLAMGSAILLDSLDTTLRDPEKAGRYLGADIIGTLPLDRETVQFPIIARHDPKVEGGVVLASSDNDSDSKEHRKGYYRRISGFEEAVRTIRNTILLADLEQRLSSIVMTSAEPGEGKTTFAIHFAIANAARGKKTLLVDGDLRRPSVHSKFALNPKEGLSNVLTDTLAWRDAVIPIQGKPNLHILPSGPGSHRAADLIGPKMAELLDEFAKEYDLVILDAPPLLGFAEGLQMATAADGVLIIARAGETKRKAVATVVTTLQRVRANIIGVVLNRVSYNTSEDGEYYYGHFRYHNYRAPE
jgi:capsular exopolysaccharide synthesis family protein